MNIADIPDNVREALHYPFDFDTRNNGAPMPVDYIWFRIEPDTKLTPVAGEGAGGIYSILADTGEVLFVTSEGAGGIIAQSLQAMLLLIVSCPYWQDLLKFSGGGDLAEMLRTAPFAEAAFYDDNPEAEEALELICESLGLAPIPDAIPLLHLAVSTSPQRLRLFAPDGHELDSLFNKYTADDAGW